RLVAAKLKQIRILCIVNSLSVTTDGKPYSIRVWLLPFAPIYAAVISPVIWMKTKLMTKKSVQEFALFGGTPLFATPLHVGRPNRPDKAAFMQHADDIWESAWLTNNGPKVQQFE